MSEHVRALTSPAVSQAEADITSAMIARAARSPVPAMIEPVVFLDVAQCEVVAALAGTGTLLVVEGAAGAGKRPRGLTATGHGYVVSLPYPLQSFYGVALKPGRLAPSQAVAWGRTPTAALR